MKRRPRLHRISQAQVQLSATFADLPVPVIGDNGPDKLVGHEMPNSEGGFAKADVRAQHARTKPIVSVVNDICRILQQG